MSSPCEALVPFAEVLAVYLGLDGVNAHLEAGSGTVGISLNISHDRATAMNDTVKATATLTAVEGRKLTFGVQAEDSKGIIGKGSHERFIINNEKFMAKVNG